ncbi:MAG: BglG family transcription antiterminator [Galactobacter sp.]
MAGRRQEALLDLLVEEPGWHTAARLADRLRVSTRTVRSYVTALNDALPTTTVITSGPDGYKVMPDGVAQLRTHRRQGGAASERPPSAPTPSPMAGSSRRDRLHQMVRALLETDQDAFELAASMHVSDATVDHDLSRVRALVREVGDLDLVRSGPMLSLQGTELARRRLLTTLVQDELTETTFDLGRFADAAGEDTISTAALASFRDALAERLISMGYFVNEFAIADLSLQVAVTVGRVRRGKPLESFAAQGDGADGDDRDRLAHVVGHLALTTLDTELGAGDRAYLASVIRTRVVVPDTARRPAQVPTDVDQAVRAAAEHVGREYAVDLTAEEFLTRLSLHMQNLVQRSKEGAITRNPLTKSLKSTYPMIFEIAVALVGEIGRRLETRSLDLNVGDDEIAYVTMHVGGELERGRTREAQLSATIVCPGYYELHELLTSSVTRSLGDDLEVVDVVTRLDPDWDALETDLVLTTIDPPAPAERIVRIRPFLTEADVDRVNTAASRLRRGRRLRRLRSELLRYVSDEAFVLPLPDDGAEAAIRRLGGLLESQGVIDAEHVSDAIDREAMSSTAFTETLAVPHSMSMTASRTALAIGVSPTGVSWGSQRVHVVVFAAFSEADREAFQTVFEQFVGAFSSPERVQALVQRVHSLPEFLDEVTQLIED